MMYKYRVIKVRNRHLEDNMFILQKRTFFGEWKSIKTSYFIRNVLDRFYELIKNKMPEDEVIIGGA